VAGFQEGAIVPGDLRFSEQGEKVWEDQRAIEKITPCKYIKFSINESLRPC
jgi:hypothetical protein